MLNVIFYPACIALILIFVYKNKNEIARYLMLAAFIIYCLRNVGDIVPIFLMMQRGVIGYQAFILVFFTIVLMLISLLCIWKKKRKASICLLWIMLIVFILQNWNTWFTLFIYLKSSLFNLMK